MQRSRADRRLTKTLSGMLWDFQPIMFFGVDRNVIGMSVTPLMEQADAASSCDLDPSPALMHPSARGLLVGIRFGRSPTRASKISITYGNHFTLFATHPGCFTSKLVAYCPSPSASSAAILLVYRLHHSTPCFSKLFGPCQIFMLTLWSLPFF